MEVFCIVQPQEASEIMKPKTPNVEQICLYIWSNFQPIWITESTSRAARRYKSISKTKVFCPVQPQPASEAMELKIPNVEQVYLYNWSNFQPIWITESTSRAARRYKIKVSCLVWLHVASEAMELKIQNVEQVSLYFWRNFQPIWFTEFISRAFRRSCSTVTL